MSLPIYIINAFERGAFTGNPAAVVPMDDWLPDETLQSIAAQNNLAETAFIKRSGQDWDLRWFTPACEVALCGHATLASGHAVFSELDTQANAVTFQTRFSGALHVSRADDGYVMDFPALKPEPCQVPESLAEGLNACPKEWLKGSYADDEGDWVAVFDNAEEVKALSPDMGILGAFPGRGVICTSPGEATDIVCRYFAPAAGIDEDPFTGSAHCILTPFWAERLGKSRISTHQMSARGGWGRCELVGERVHLFGYAQTYLTGSINF